MLIVIQCIYYCDIVECTGKDEATVTNNTHHYVTAHEDNTTVTTQVNQLKHSASDVVQQSKVINNIKRHMFPIMIYYSMMLVRWLLLVTLPLTTIS